MTVETILIDCDGVLTDGCLTIDHRGEKMFKKFHTRDVRAIRELVFSGYCVVLVTADDWPGIYTFADKVGAEVLILKDKQILPYSNFHAVGDDAWDVPMLAAAVRAFVPADADASVLALPNVVHLKTCGGKGVIAEVVANLLQDK